MFYIFRIPKMFWAALTSRSATYPQAGQTWVRTDNDFCTSSPHLEHFCVVKRGLTLITRPPALSALLVRIITNAPHAASGYPLGHALCQFRSRQTANVQVLDHDRRVRICIPLRGLEVEVLSLALDLQMRLCRTT